MIKYGKLPIWLFSFVILSLPMKALVVEKATLEEITNESKLIVYGKIIEKSSQWEGKQINTYLTLQVYDVAKGNEVTNTIRVKQRGGKVGAYTSEISGQPNFEVGDEVFFFLVDWKGNYWIHSIALGGYSIVETGGVKYAVNGFDNVQLVEPVNKKEGEELKGEYTLPELSSKIKIIAATE